MSKKIETVAVIGAGVSGVATTAYLKEAGVKVTVFERTGKPGGIWNFDSRKPPEPAYPSIVPSIAETAYFEDYSSVLEANKESGGTKEKSDIAILHAPPGPCYELLQNNIPTGMMKLKLNSWPPGTEPTVRHNVLGEYIRDTAAKTGVNDVAQYNTKVEHLTKEGDHWNIETSTLDLETLEKNKKSWEFDAVVVATGHYHAPQVPDIPGLKEWKKAWPSRIQHSKRYRTPREYEGKTVLIIGGSTSSFDIAKEVIHTAKKVYQSTRNGEFDHPISMLAPGVIRVPEIASFNLDETPESTSDSMPIPGTIKLVDGQVISGVDDVVLATGYLCTFPFLSEYHRDDVPPTEVDEKTLVTDGLQMHNLHKDIFYIPDPTLAFIGVPYYTATFSLFEFQAITIAAVYSGKASLPAEVDLRAEYNKRVEEKGYGRSFHSLKGKDPEYANELLAWINPGIVAAGGKAVEGHSPEWHEQFKILAEKFRGIFKPETLIETPDVATLTETVEAIKVH